MKLLSLKKIFENSKFITTKKLRLYHYAGNNPVKYTDLDGNTVTAVATITSITEKPLGFTAKGSVTFTDDQTGESITANFFSGGIPYGLPTPIGSYDILQPTKEGHYRLEAKDDKYGDDKVSGTDQSLLRLHEKGRGNTMGCISIEDDSDWEKVNNLLENTDKSETTVKSKSRNPFAQKTEQLDNYGTLTVKREIVNSCGLKFESA